MPAESAAPADLAAWLLSTPTRRAVIKALLRSSTPASIKALSVVTGRPAATVNGVLAALLARNLVTIDITVAGVAGQGGAAHHYRIDRDAVRQLWQALADDLGLAPTIIDLADAYASPTRRSSL